MGVKSLRGWREEILRRDNYTCQKCGKTDELEVHHLLPRGRYPGLALQVSNGITLCAECHRKEPAQGGGGCKTVTVEKIKAQVGGRVVDEMELEEDRVKVSLSLDTYTKLLCLKAKYGFSSMEDVIIFLTDSWFGMHKSLDELCSRMQREAEEMIRRQVDVAKEDLSPWYYLKPLEDKQDAH